MIESTKYSAVAEKLPQRELFYKSNEFDIGIYSLRQMPRDRLLLLYADIIRQISSLNDQIKAATLTYKTTGQKADPEWLKRIRTKRSIVVSFYAHVCAELGIARLTPQEPLPKDRTVRRRTSSLGDTPQRADLAKTLAAQILDKFTNDQILKLLSTAQEK